LVLDIVAWIAVFLLSLGYPILEYKLYSAQEVLGLSFWGYCSLAVSFIVLFVATLYEFSLKLSVRQILALIPTLYIIYKIHESKHRQR